MNGSTSWTGPIFQTIHRLRGRGAIPLAVADLLEATAEADPDKIAQELSVVTDRLWDAGTR